MRPQDRVDGVVDVCPHSWHCLERLGTSLDQVGSLGLENLRHNLFVGGQGLHIQSSVEAENPAFPKKFSTGSASFQFKVSAGQNDSANNLSIGVLAGDVGACRLPYL